jgi:hypothetical protein
MALFFDYQPCCKDYHWWEWWSIVDPQVILILLIIMKKIWLRWWYDVILIIILILLIIFRFIFTILGYATVFLPCYVLIHLSRRHNLHTLGEYKTEFWKFRFSTLFFCRRLSVETTTSDIDRNHFRNCCGNRRQCFWNCKAIKFGI